MSIFMQFFCLQVKQSTSSEFDQIANRMNTSPKNTPQHQDPNTHSVTSLTSIDSGINSQSTHNESNDESLSDSLNVNLSNMNLDDSQQSMATSNNSSAMQSTPKKLDKSFLAELEKDLYKHQKPSVNEFQTYGQKEATVNQISMVLNNSATKIYESTKHMNFNNQSSPHKVPNATSINKNSNQLNYEAFINKSGSFKNYDSTVNFTKQPSSNDTTNTVNSIWMDRNVNQSNNVYGNSMVANNVSSNSMSQLAEHNFQALSNRPLPSYAYQYNSTANVYSSVAGDLYGSVAGDIYEQVAETPANLYSNYGAIPRPKGNSILTQTNSFSAIDLSNTSRELSTAVIYDEVANDTVDGLRPTRAAPLPPQNLGAGQQTLSHQQIQRRLEKMAFQQQQVDALMQILGEEASDVEARLALEAVNWDQNAAVRHFKIERLFR